MQRIASEPRLDAFCALLVFLIIVSVASGSYAPQASHPRLTAIVLKATGLLWRWDRIRVILTYLARATRTPEQGASVKWIEVASAGPGVGIGDRSEVIAVVCNCGLQQSMFSSHALLRDRNVSQTSKIGYLQSVPDSNVAQDDKNST